MKTKVLMIITLLLLLCGCRANLPVSQQSGKEDIAFLLFVSAKEYKNKDVTVTLDEATPFTARVVNARKANRRGTQYGVGVGTHQLTVSSGDRTIYNKQIFLSTQEVKTITLP